MIVSPEIVEIRTTSLFVAFQSSLSCSSVAIIHDVNNAHSHVFTVIVVALAVISAVILEKTTLSVGIVAVFNVYTASRVSFGFKQ